MGQARKLSMAACAEQSFSALDGECAAQRMQVLEDLRNKVVAYCAVLPDELKPPLEALPIDEEALRQRSRLYARRELDKAGLRGIYHPFLQTRTPLDLSTIQLSALTVEGQQHLCCGAPCQDSTAVRRMPHALIGVVSDGVGSAPLSHFGSWLISNELADLAEMLVTPNKAPLLTPQFLSNLHVGLYVAIFNFMRTAGLHPTDAWNLFACATAQLLIVTPQEAVVLALGDGFVGWQGQLSPITELTQRGFRWPANIPPLPGFDLYLDALTERNNVNDMGAFLQQEAHSFKIAAYGAAADACSGGLLLSTDGLAYAGDIMSTKQLRARGERWAFPFLDVLRERGTDWTEQLIRLHHLAVGARGSDRSGIQLFYPRVLRQLLLDSSAIDTDSVLSSRIADSIGQALINASGLSGARDFEPAIQSGRWRGRESELSCAAVNLLSQELSCAIPQNPQPLYDDIGCIFLTPRNRPLPTASLD